MIGANFVEVNACYSSTIGNLNYGKDNIIPDPVASSIEIARRGRYKYINGKSIYPTTKNEENLNRLWKNDSNWSSKSWKNIHKMFKKSGLRYRASMESLDSTQLKLFKKRKWLIQNYKPLDLFICF